MSLKDHARRLLQARAEKIERLNRRDSNVTMNLIKAYCIIYIVSVHIWETAIDFPLSNWVIHSHIMALFAFVSGYFYKPSADEIPWGVFLMQKVRALLVPYFIWNLVYLTITTLLNAFTPLRYGDSLSLNALFIRPWTDSMHCAFMAPAWYIPAFFLSMMMLFTLRRGMKKLRIFNEYFLWCITLLIATLSIILSEKGYHTGFMHTVVKAGYFLPYLQGGLVFRRHEGLFYRKKAFSVGLILVLIYILSLLPLRPVDVNMPPGIFGGSPFLLISWTILNALLAIIICEMLIAAPSYSAHADQPGLFPDKQAH